MGCGAGSWREFAQVPGVRFFFFQPDETVHDMGRLHRWGISDYCEPWHRPTHRAKIAGGTRSKAVSAGVAFERSRDPVSVWALSFCGSDAVCLLSGAVG